MIINSNIVEIVTSQKSAFPKDIVLFFLRNILASVSKKIKVGKIVVNII